LRSPAARRGAPVAEPDRILRTGAIFEVLTAHGVEFVVVGGVAVQAHGYIRSTADVDIVPRPTLLNLSRLGEALVELEATPRRGSAAVNLSNPQVLKRHPMIALVTRDGRLDVVSIEHLVGAPRAYDELDSRALVIRLAEIEVRVCGLDDLLRMKRAAGRQQDRIDIAALTRTDEELDDEASRST
jgi:hypothetical protein